MARSLSVRSCQAALIGRSCGPDGTIEVVARYTIRSDKGALVYVQNDGLRVASPEVLARMSKGELVPVGSYHFRTAPDSNRRALAEMAGTCDLHRRCFTHARPASPSAFIKCSKNCSAFLSRCKY